jgi:hypothetical protein
MEGVAALFEKGEAFDNFVKTFRKIQVPAKYKGEERAEIDKQLKQLDEKLVKPIEGKVQEILTACTTRAAQFFVANEYAAKCREKLKNPAMADPKGIFPQPNYWTTRSTGEGVAKK